MGTKAEDQLARHLKAEGIEFEREVKFHPTRMWRADFLLPAYDLLIEVEGISYRGQVGRHQTGQGFQKDAVKYNEAVLLGYTLLRFTPAMVQGTAMSPLKGVKREEKAIDTIKRYISDKGFGTGGK